MTKSIGNVTPAGFLIVLAAVVALVMLVLPLIFEARNPSPTEITTETTIR